jgi:hypothetical protein
MLIEQRRPSFGAVRELMGWSITRFPKAKKNKICKFLRRK